MTEDADREWEWERAVFDTGDVMQRLALAAEPVAVEMTGRHVAFEFASGNSEHRDAASVMQRLDLSAEPAVVSITDSELTFKYPIPTEDNDAE